MSSSKGNTKRTRSQKYQNRTAFKNNLYDKSDQQKKLNNLHVSEVCAHCKEVIEWKIKYKKYKPLTQPKTCTKCSRKTVKKAYHVLCRECAINSKCCAKCLKSSQVVEIIPSKPDELEQQKLKSEMDQLIKSLPERKRRSFLRYMAKGQKPENDEELNIEDKKEIVKIPHSRETLLKKIEELKVNEDDDEFGFTDDEDDDYGENEEEDISDSDENEENIDCNDSNNNDDSDDSDQEKSGNLNNKKAGTSKKK